MVDAAVLVLAQRRHAVAPDVPHLLPPNRSPRPAEGGREGRSEWGSGVGGRPRARARGRGRMGAARRVEEFMRGSVRLWLAMVVAAGWVSGGDDACSGGFVVGGFVFKNLIIILILVFVLEFELIDYVCLKDFGWIM